MTLVRYQPFGLLNDVKREFDRVLDSHLVGLHADDNSAVVTSHWTPAVDIREEAGRFALYADLPGVDVEDIDITMEDGVLTIKGERHADTDQEQQALRRAERSRGTFYRRFSLPDTADADSIEATSKDGVLQVTIAKHEKVQPRKIKVKT